MKKYSIVGLLCMSLFFLACNTEPHPVSFYHWRTGLALEPIEQEFVNKLNARKMYVRAFDLTWNPLAASEEEHYVMKMKPDSLSLLDEIVPVIFITNEVILNIPDTQLEAMAARTIFKLNRTVNFLKRNSPVVIKELQIDCDWSGKTRDKYFTFLEYLKREAKQIDINAVSVTIRLHQIKYKDETGVPPVNAGVLMFYNMGNVNNINETNSILDNNIGAQYLETIDDYPLRLDVALPIFGWGVQFRDTRAIQIIPNLSHSVLQETGCCSKTETGSIYTVENGMYVSNIYVYPGDKIKVEEASISDVKKAASLISEHLSGNYSILFYHLNRPLLEKLTVTDLQEIADIH